MSDAKIRRFPINRARQIHNRRGRRAVNCYVSGRYMRFGKVSEPMPCFPEPDRIGTLVIIDVMTEAMDEDQPDWKLCELVVPIEELEEVLTRAKKEPA